jgi:hypothetical protein
MPGKCREDRDCGNYERCWKGYERYCHEVNLQQNKGKSIVELHLKTLNYKIGIAT